MEAPGAAGATGAAVGGGPGAEKGLPSGDGRRESEGDVVFYVEEPKAGRKQSRRRRCFSYNSLLFRDSRWVNNVGCSEIPSCYSNLLSVENNQKLNIKICYRQPVTNSVLYC